MTESIFGGSSIATPEQLERGLQSIPRPFVVINGRELSVLRRGLTKDGWKRALYLKPAEQERAVYAGSGLLSVANQWLEADIRIPERGGHIHRFYCDCGTMLSAPDDMEVGGSYACPACGRGFSGEDYDGALRYLLHNRLAGAALSLALVYGIERDPAYADKAAEILLQYARAYTGPHTDHLTGGMLYQSLCEAVWAIPLAQAYDLICLSRALSESDRRAIEDSLFRPIASGLRQVGIDGNWGSWHLSAVGVIGLAIKDADLVHYALSSFETQIREQLGEDGLWPESIHCYHFYPLRAFVHLAEGCSRLGVDLYSYSAGPNRSLRAMFRAPLDYAYPSFRLPAINDGWYDSFLPLDLYEIAVRRWGDLAFAWVLKRGYKASESPVSSDHRCFADRFKRGSFYAFLFGRDIPGRILDLVPSAQSSPSLGMCILRNERLAATLDYGPCLPHGHLDKLSFTLFADDELRVPDYGTPGYGSRIADFYRGTAAHNTVMVDGVSQQPARENGLKSIHAGNAVQCVEAVANDCYPGVTHDRQMVLLSDALIILDRVTAQEEHTYDWLMRCEGVPEVKGNVERREFGPQPEGPIRIERSWAMPECCQVDWGCERGGLSLGLWSCSGGGAAALGTAPAETAEKTSSLFIGRQTGTETVFLAAVVPLREGERVEMDKAGGVARILRADGADYVYLREADWGLTRDGLVTDAQMAVVQVRSGEIRALAIVRGSRLVWNGESVVESTSPVECLEVSFEERSPVVRYQGVDAGVVRLKTSARAIRVNGFRVAAAVSDGQAVLRVTPEMLSSTSP